MHDQNSQLAGISRTGNKEEKRETSTTLAIQKEKINFVNKFTLKLKI